MRNILISFVFLVLFSANFAQAAKITLAINPNSTTEPAGYKLYYGSESRSLAAYTSNKDLNDEDVQSEDDQFEVTLPLDRGKIYYFAATAYDGSGNESGFSNEVSKTVPPNQAPVPQDGSLTTNENSSVSASLLATDPEGDPLTYTIVSNGSLGTVTLNNSITGTYTYKPNSNANGTDTFTFKVNDGFVDSNIGTVTVTVNPHNDAPIAAADSATTNEDIAVTINVLANDSDTDGDTLFIASVTQPGHGATQISSGKIVYTPAANYNGADSFNYTASDGKGGTATGTVTVTVNPINDAPHANAGPDCTLTEDASVTLDGTGSFDPDDGITSYLWTQTSGPSVTIGNPTSATSNFRVPLVDQIGAILTFQLKVTDHGGLTDTDSVNVSIINTDNVATVYEDAEDGSIAGWTIYDNDPAGATISNEYDSVRQSRVIKFAGTNINNGYRLQNADGNPWQNESQFVIEWSMNFAENFWICVNVQTTAGQRYLSYLPVNNNNILGKGRYVNFGLGSMAKNGIWQTIVRDLQSDLDKAQPGVKIKEVNGLLLRGSGLIDDIKLQ